MRILMLTSQPPWPLAAGNQIYEHNLAAHLGGRHDLDLLCLADTRDEAEGVAAIRGLFRRTRCVIGRRRGHLERLGALLLEGDWLHNRDDVPALRAAVREMAAERYDVVQVHSLGLTPYAALLGGAPSLAVPYDCQSLLYERAAASSRGWRRTYCRLQTLRLRAWERAWLPRFDRCVVVSPVDAGSLCSRIPGLQVEVVPFGVDTERFRPSPVPEEEATIVFAGNMTYFPNRQAAREVARKVLPLVRREAPAARLKVVGDATGEVGREIASPSVEVVGFTDVRPHLASATVCVSPMTVGAGFKNKVVEALAMGKAMVATPLSLEGIDAVPGTHVLSAGDPESMAAAVVRLLRDAGLRRDLGRRGRDLVVEKYSWKGVADRFEALHASLAAGRARRTPARGRKAA